MQSDGLRGAEAPCPRRLRIFHAVTGEFVLEPTHPWLGKVRGFMIKKWIWAHANEQFPRSGNVFNLQLIKDQHSVDDFSELRELSADEIVDLQVVYRQLPQASARVRKSFVDAIQGYEPRKLWRLLSAYQMPRRLRTQYGDEVNPLIMLLQSPNLVTENPIECPRALEMLLEANCSPNEMGVPQQSPLLYAIGCNDPETVQYLLSARAEVNYTPSGREPPLCVAVRGHMVGIARLLLEYGADVNVRGFGIGNRQEGATLEELATGNPAILAILHEHRLSGCGMHFLSGQRCSSFSMAPHGGYAE